MIANTEKKIVIRKAPVEKASTYEIGFIATGSDNEKYIVTEMKNGFKRWTKMKVEPEKEVVVEPEPVKPKRSYKKKVVEPIVIVEPEPEPVVIVEPEPEMVPVKPKRSYKKKTVSIVEAEPVAIVEPEPVAIVEAEPVKPKRSYKKKKAEQKN